MTRLTFLAAALVSGALGYWLRFDAPVPYWVRDGSGGVAYVVFWICLAGFVGPKLSAFRAAVCVLAATCTLEFLQQWHPVWLEAMRRTLPGRLVLGTTFEWSDLPPYFVGALLGWGVARVVQRSKPAMSPGDSTTS